MLDRRTFLDVGCLAATSLVAATARGNTGEPPLPAVAIATNTYSWKTFAHRKGRNLELHTNQLLGDIAATGIRGYEPNIESPADFTGLRDRLRDHGLEMRSIYVNSVLHEPAHAQRSIDHVLAIAERAKEFGTHIVVTNPAPLLWGGTEDKSDDQLKHQAESLNRLGERLRGLGFLLAYHNHDSEFRQGGREFHHMLLATSPENVHFCLDAHWVYRGSGNSELALFDVLSVHKHRIVELHLRQSLEGIWTDTFQMQGDIDYSRLLGAFCDARPRPHLVLEQAVEPESKVTSTVVEAHRLGLQNLQRALR